MVIVDHVFEDWLNGPMGDGTRKEYAEGLGIDTQNLRWAFGAGYVRGQQQVFKELQDV
jgi:hypothetical protein